MTQFKCTVCDQPFDVPSAALALLGMVRTSCKPNVERSDERRYYLLAS